MEELYSKEGICNLALGLFVSAVKDNHEAFLTSDLGLACKDIIETRSGLTTAYLKKILENEIQKRKLELNEVIEDTSVLTLKQLAYKWKRTEKAMRSYLDRNNINVYVNKEEVCVAR